MADKVNNIMEVEQSVRATNLFQYDTITKRSLFESKADSLIIDQIASKLKNNEAHQSLKGYFRLR